MNEQPVGKELDPTPLVRKITETSQAGRLKWQATADEHAFIASVGGDTTLKITMERDVEIDYSGNPEMVDKPVLCTLDANGRTLWEIHSSEVNGGLWPLYKLAQRIGNKLDEKMTTLMEALQRI